MRAFFSEMFPLGEYPQSFEGSRQAVFRYSPYGVDTGRDWYVHSYSREACAENARLMIKEYLAALQVYADRYKGIEDGSQQAVADYSKFTKWDAELKKRMRRGESTHFDPGHIVKTAYRPFIAAHLYSDPVFLKNWANMHRYFPNADVQNRAICVTGFSKANPYRPFSAFMTSLPPNNYLLGPSRYYPRFRYFLPDLSPLENITDAALHFFQTAYGRSSIVKDDIYDYVYGILHSPQYRQRYKNDLALEFPRIPTVPDFDAFASAGRELAELHTGYESCAEYPLGMEPPRQAPLDAEDCRIEKRMVFADWKTKEELVVNSRLKLTGIPEEAHRYVVNGYSPLEWLVSRYQVKRDKFSGILNDVNAWFADDPTGLVSAIQRAVHVGVESARIIESLPPIE